MSGLQTRMRRTMRISPSKRLLSTSIPAPVLGWNARDALSAMDPRFALVMENYFADGSRVRLRSGSEDHVTGITGPVEYLHTFAKGSQRKLVAFANGSAYDATVSGAVGAPLATGFASNRWFGVNAGANPGERAIYANGTDPAQYYDGTTWGAAGITGPTKPTGSALSKKRVWLIEAGTGEAWYGPPEAVTGAFSKFDVGSVHPDGGELVAIGNVTLDGAQGPDDMTVFVMKSGAILVYLGTDPGDAANWALKGVWKAGVPLGERCLVPFDDDLIYISNTGFRSIVALTAPGRLAGVPISDNISGAVSDASQVASSLYGWHGIYYPKKRQLLFNVPRTESVLSDQYVMNSLYQGWSRFRNWNMICSAVKDQDLFMGVSGKIIKATDGGLDSGQSITGYIQTAWNYFDARGQEKHFLQYRPHFLANDVVEFGIGIGVDYQDPIIPFRSSTDPPVGAQWGVDEWDVGVWGQTPSITSDWRGAGANGSCASIAYQTTTRSTGVEILATDMLMKVGHPI